MQLNITRSKPLFILVLCVLTLSIVLPAGHALPEQRSTPYGFVRLPFVVGPLDSIDSLNESIEEVNSTLSENKADDEAFRSAAEAEHNGMLDRIRDLELASISRDQHCQQGKAIAGIDEDGLILCLQIPTYDGSDFALSDQQCPQGAAIRAIEADGSIVCSMDDDSDLHSAIANLTARVNALEAALEHADGSQNGTNVSDGCEGFVSQQTTCGTGACGATGHTICSNGTISDTCEPGTPAASDATCNGVDDDCDGSVDEDFASQSTSCGTGTCSATGMTQCTNGEVTDTCSPKAPASMDATCNGVDDDCDGSVDEDFAPQSTSCGVGACASTGSTICSAGSVSDTCTPGEPGTETCNGIDDDCDGQIDENVCT